MRLAGAEGFFNLLLCRALRGVEGGEVAICQVVGHAKREQGYALVSGCERKRALVRAAAA